MTIFHISFFCYFMSFPGFPIVCLQFLYFTFIFQIKLCHAKNDHFGPPTFYVFNMFSIKTPQKWWQISDPLFSLVPLTNISLLSLSLFLFLSLSLSLFLFLFLSLSLFFFKLSLTLPIFHHFLNSALLNYPPLLLSLSQFLIQNSNLLIFRKTKQNVENAW